jgi:hypothetical protein
MMASGGSNGEEGPKSTTKPMFLDELFQVTVVPDCTQKSAFDLALGIFGVAEAELLPLRLTSTSQGVEGEPQVLLNCTSSPGAIPCKCTSRGRVAVPEPMCYSQETATAERQTKM